MELSHLSYEGDRQQDDDQDKEKRRRFNPINPVTKKAVSGWFGPAPAESSPKSPTDPEYRMPVSIVAPEAGEQQSRTVSHEAAMRSDVWLGGQVRPPAENQGEPAESEPSEFQRLLERAGLDELARPLEENKDSDRQESPAVANVPETSNTDLAAAVKSREASRANRAPRTRALIARAAGMITAMNLGQEKSRPELIRTLHKIDERIDADHAQPGNGSYDHQRFQSPFERQPVTPSAERTQATSEQEEDDEVDPFNLAPEEHVEHDAWHSIVVDKYGREDVNARMQYGQAFRQEQREVQQSALSDTTPVTQDSNVAQPQFPQPAAPAQQQMPAPAYISQPQQYVPIAPTNDVPMISGPVPEPRLPMSTPQVPSLPSGISQPQLPNGVPVREDPQHLLPAHAKTGASLIVNPWVWLVGGLLILVFFVASLIG